MATTKKGLIQSAVDSVSGIFESPPAPPPRKTPKRAASVSSKKAAAKQPPAKKAAAKMDRKLVSAMEDYEVKYLAQKHKVTQKAVKEAVAKVGSSRTKVETELKSGKAK